MILSYGRVSTPKQGEDDKYSLPDQLRKCRAIAQMRNADRFEVNEYVDNGVSGSVQLTKRPAGGRLWTEMKAGDIVVAAKLDRMFRSASDALNMLERFSEREVKVILLDIGMEPVGESATSEAFFGLMAVFANLERRMINDRTANGKFGKRSKGGHIGGDAPYGWRVQGRDKTAMLVPDEAEQEVVAFICERMTRNVRQAKILVQMTAAGYKTRDGKDFWYTQIQRIYDYEMRRRKWGEVA